MSSGLERQPEDRAELVLWVREKLHLTAHQEQSLLTALDNVLAVKERLWAQSKQDAIQAVTAGFAERLQRMRDELAAKDATVTSITNYFEGLVAELTDRMHRDPKTRLMNFGRFLERLEMFLALEQRGRWCAIGLIDINSFKWYNDTLGHALGDRIIDRIASLIREKIRGVDFLAREQENERLRLATELHARFGGDEFCFLVPEIDDPSNARNIADRFRESVTGFDWTTEDARLILKPVQVDIGVVCLRLGPVTERRKIAKQIAHELFTRADILMYQAKGGMSFSNVVCMEIVNGNIVDVPSSPNDTVA